MKKALFPLLAFSIAISACGGGGDNDEPAPAPAPAPAHPMQGAWQGSAPTGEELHAVVLDDGDLWLIATKNGTPVVQVHGNTRVAGNSFTGHGVRYADYVSGQLANVGLTGSYVSNTRISATVSYGGAQASYNLTPLSKSIFDYDRPAQTSDLVGTWTVSGSQIRVGNNGSVDVIDRGCYSTGTVTPHSSRKNVFNLSVTMGAAPCALPGQKMDGIAVTWRQSGQSVLLAALENPSASFTVLAAR